MKNELITQYGFDKIKDTIKHIKEVEVPENIKNLEIAASYGDLRENAEYEAETDRQMFLRNRLAELEHLIAISRVIDPSKSKLDKISFGLTFKIEDIDTGEESIYTLVGGYESNPNKHKISYNSPFARLFIGKEIGDEVKTNFNNQEAYYEIIDIWYDEKILKED